MEWTLMILSRKGDYGLRAALELACFYGTGFLSAQRIARRHHLPGAFVKKLLQKLNRAGIVTATVGQQGGYALARSPQEISIRELLEALEGDLSPVTCLSPDADCQIAAGCLTQHVWSHIDGKLKDALGSVSLQDALDLANQKGGRRDVKLPQHRNGG